MLNCSALDFNSRERARGNILGTREISHYSRKMEDSIMSRKCSVCSKGPQYGNRVSHAHNQTRHR
ncbi:hypothetical protein CSA17_02715, partial [bacterium DOLJORAL78_65_58]